MVDGVCPPWACPSMMMKNPKVVLETEMKKSLEMMMSSEVVLETGMKKSSEMMMSSEVVLETGMKKSSEMMMSSDVVLETEMKKSSEMMMSSEVVLETEMKKSSEMMMTMRWPAWRTPRTAKMEVTEVLAGAGSWMKTEMGGCGAVSWVVAFAWRWC